MVTINNGNILFNEYKIPIMEINEFVNNNDKLLLEASMQDLFDIFVFGIPENFKDLLLKKVRLYDASSAVNSFTYKGKEYWLDKTQRMSILNLLNSYSSIHPKEDSKLEIILGNDIYSFSIEEIFQLIAKLEEYAYQCKINTQKHINAINAIQEPTSSEEEIDFINSLVNYNFTVGYPNKLEL